MMKKTQAKDKKIEPEQAEQKQAKPAKVADGVWVLAKRAAKVGGGKRIEAGKWVQLTQSQLDQLKAHLSTADFIEIDADPRTLKVQ